MIDCNLTQLDNGKWWCPAPGCDDEQERLLPGNYRRNCRSLEAGFSPREHIEREIAFFVKDGTATRTTEQIAATLDKCFGGCRYLDGNCTAWINAARSNCDRRRVAWIEHLIHHDCELWTLVGAAT